MIYAIKRDSNSCEILESLKRGEGRFGWSYIETANLQKLKQRIEKDGWDSLLEGEKDCYQPFLLDFKPGDYVVYINVPEWGKCTIAKVTGEYQWRYESDDFNHRFPVGHNAIYVFDRNDAVVHPAVRTRLKLQGRWWRISLKDEFNELLEALKKGHSPSQRTPKANLRFLSNEIQPFLLGITQQVHHTHPNYDLEALFEEVFKLLPGVIEVRRQGGAGDHGADILVTFQGGIPIPGLEKQFVLVVQLKSFKDKHCDTRAVEDLRRAFEHYPDASMGLIISTADSVSTEVEQELDKLREKSCKQVAILVGADVAALLLRYGAKLLAQQQIPPTCCCH